MKCSVYQQDCENFLNDYNHEPFALTFLDPPFNQNKEYNNHNDNMLHDKYWSWMERICCLILNNSLNGAAIYFMQREKNTQFVLNTLSKSGWTFQNLIIWKKKTSAVPSSKRFGKHYQIIAFATKGKSPRLFNRLRIDPPLLETEKIPRQNGRYVTDVWDDIRELTSGYFAGDEALRQRSGERFHKQQSPVKLLTRIILSSSMPGDLIFDPFAGTGTTLVVAKQLNRDSIGVEIDHSNSDIIKDRISKIRESDKIIRLRKDYKYTDNLAQMWPCDQKIIDFLYNNAKQMRIL
jgi:site-specific DNA-methyltransferase (adenine-specific)